LGGAGGGDVDGERMACLLLLLLLLLTLRQATTLFGVRISSSRPSGEDGGEGRSDSTLRLLSLLFLLGCASHGNIRGMVFV
jgi:hypothetical protein